MIEIDTHTMADIDGMAAIDSEWNAEMLLDRLKASRLRQAYVALTTGRNVIGYCMTEAGHDWLTIVRLQVVCSDEATELLVDRAKQSARIIDRKRATSRLAGRPRLLAGVSIWLAPEDTGANDLLRRLGFRARDALRDDDAYLLGILMAWTIPETAT